MIDAKDIPQKLERESLQALMWVKIEWWAYGAIWAIVIDRAIRVFV
jgi:hypothetical protein